MQEVAEGRDAEGGNRSSRSSCEGKEDMNPGELRYHQRPALQCNLKDRCFCFLHLLLAYLVCVYRKVALQLH